MSLTLKQMLLSNCSQSLCVFSHKSNRIFFKFDDYSHDRVFQLFQGIEVERMADRPTVCLLKLVSSEMHADISFVKH